MNLKQFFKSRKRGFTLSEVLVVIIVIAILAAIATPIYNRAIKRSRASDALKVLSVASAKQESFLLSNDRFASSFSELRAPIKGLVGKPDDSVPVGAFEYLMQPSCIVAVRMQDDIRIFRNFITNQEGCVGEGCVHLQNLIPTMDSVGCIIPPPPGGDDTGDKGEDPCIKNPELCKCPPHQVVHNGRCCDCIPDKKVNCGTGKTRTCRAGCTWGPCECDNVADRAKCVESSSGGTWLDDSCSCRCPGGKELKDKKCVCPAERPRWDSNMGRCECENPLYCVGGKWNDEKCICDCNDRDRNKCYQGEGVFNEKNCNCSCKHPKKDFGKIPVSTGSGDRPPADLPVGGGMAPDTEPGTGGGSDPDDEFRCVCLDVYRQACAKADPEAIFNENECTCDCPSGMVKQHFLSEADKQKEEAYRLCEDKYKKCIEAGGGASCKPCTPITAADKDESMSFRCVCSQTSIDDCTMRRGIIDPKNCSCKCRAGQTMHSGWCYCDNDCRRTFVGCDNNTGKWQLPTYGMHNTGGGVAWTYAFCGCDGQPPGCNVPSGISPTDCITSTEPGFSGRYPPPNALDRNSWRCEETGGRWYDEVGTSTKSCHCDCPSGTTFVDKGIFYGSCQCDDPGCVGSVCTGEGVDYPESKGTYTFGTCKCKCASPMVSRTLKLGDGAKPCVSGPRCVLCGNDYDEGAMAMGKLSVPCTAVDSGGTWDTSGRIPGDKDPSDPPGTPLGEKADCKCICPKDMTWDKEGTGKCKCDNPLHEYLYDAKTNAYKCMCPVVKPTCPTGAPECCPTNAGWEESICDCKCPEGQMMYPGSNECTACPSNQFYWGASHAVYGGPACLCKNDCPRTSGSCNSLTGVWEGANPHNVVCPFGSVCADFERDTNSKRCTDSGGTWVGPGTDVKNSCYCDCSLAPAPYSPSAYSCLPCYCYGAKYKKRMCPNGKTVQNWEFQCDTSGTGKGTWVSLNNC